MCVDGRLEEAQRTASSDTNDGRLVRVHQQSSQPEINPSHDVISRVTESTVQTEVTTTRVEVHVHDMDSSQSSTRQSQT